MAKVDGFNVQFSHRGAWTADLLPPGKDKQVIPVTWTKDWDRKAGTVLVWLKKEEDIPSFLEKKDGFLVAIARKNEDGSGASENIIGIFLVKPIEASYEPRQGVICTVEKRVRPGDV